MRNLKYLVLAISALSFGTSCPPTGTGNQRQFTANFTGAQEVPPVTTNATGSGTFTLSADQTSLQYNISARNFGSTVTLAHFHQNPPGQDGDIVENISANIQGDATQLTIQGTWSDLTTVELNALLNGNIYVNIHTQNNPGGEIRGQLVAAP